MRQRFKKLRGDDWYDFLTYSSQQELSQEQSL